MKTIRVSEATNTQLDWLVAKCKEESVYLDYHGQSRHVPGQFSEEEVYSPTHNWSLMGPIIEREKIRLDPRESYWQAQSFMTFETAYGNTGLIAAARCYVVSKLGDVVEVPEELV